jgi:hypothetical protein
VKATHGAAALIAAKRQKTVPHPSLLLEAQPEILWKIFFFYHLRRPFFFVRLTGITSTN